ncbi:MAG TPA: GHMP kinase, partial [Clostridiales bacterium]|nr:GHMP kinase [Clostridiales bacterium]
MMIRAKAPLRISFAGGGTDVPPYCHEYGGTVINATINRYASVEVVPDNTRRIEAVSMDLDVVDEYSCDEEVDLGGKLGLVRAALKNMNVREGCRLVMQNDAPPGSGLGSSSALVVALTAAINSWRNGWMDRRTLAEKAVQIEREDLGIAGGYQDQYTAAFGGINFMEFRKGETIVEPLSLSAEMLTKM